MKRDVLIIEDLDSDFEMMTRGLRRHSRADVRFLRMRGVQDASAYLDQAALADVPGFIVLDLRLLDGDGRELLGSFKKRSGWSAVPVVVWSASEEPSVRETCLREGAQDFVSKAADYNLARHNIEQIARQWLASVS